MASRYENVEHTTDPELLRQMAQDMLSAEIAKAGRAVRRAENRAAAILARADAIADQPQDEYEDGTVIVWDRTFQPASTTYTYAAVKFRGSQWAVSGRTSTYFTWDQLWLRHLSRADEGSLYWASELTPIEL